jgi:hypothetical protein
MIVTIMVRVGVRSDACGPTKTSNPSGSSIGSACVLAMQARTLGIVALRCTTFTKLFWIFHCANLLLLYALFDPNLREPRGIIFKPIES